tara:strand:- start:41 stop:184 length:144 start_codon:yes stop_codon:yes gene_type:complete
MNTNFLKRTTKKQSVYLPLFIFDNTQVNTGEFDNYESYRWSTKKDKK